jgi:tRNA(Ile)-lysidine synthase
VERACRLVSVVGAWLRELSAGGVVAVSGGPDSVALLRAMLAARPDEKAPLVMAHLNHQLRGADSDADEEFVVKLHRSLAAEFAGLELERAQLDVGRLAREQGENLEALARRERYAWLVEVARARGLGWVATGHTANDQAETVLHHLLRGTGLAGLRGIAPRRPLEAGIEVVRPLLPVTRAEVLAYLADLNQPSRRDSSNADLHYTRNRIRHELLPHLAERYNPRIAEVLARLAAQAEEVSRAEEESGADVLREAELPRAGALVILDAGKLSAAPPRLVRMALRLLWQREGWPSGGMGHEHWQRLADLVRAEGGACDLPEFVHARRRGHVLQLGRSL